MENEIVNRVVNSSLKTVDLEELYKSTNVGVFDIADYLFEGIVLKEKDFRQTLKAFDWTTYNGKSVAIYCSADAIVPRWAYILVATYLAPIADFYAFGDLDALKTQIFLEKINQLDTSIFIDQKVVIKGCSKIEVPNEAYIALSRKLLPVVSSLMYGEPCSTVPLFKKAK